MWRKCDGCEGEVWAVESGSALRVTQTSTRHSVLVMADVLRQGDGESVELVFCEIASLIDHCPESLVPTVVPALCERVRDWDDVKRFAVALVFEQLLRGHRDLWRCDCIAWQALSGSLYVLRNSELSATLCDTELKDMHKLWRSVICLLVPILRLTQDRLDVLLDLVRIDAGSHASSDADATLGAALIGALGTHPDIGAKRDLMIDALDGFTNDETNEEVYASALCSIEQLCAHVSVCRVNSGLLPHVLRATGAHCDPKLRAEALRVLTQIASEKLRGSRRSRSIQLDKEEHSATLELVDPAASIALLDEPERECAIHIQHEVLPSVLCEECKFSSELAEDVLRLILDDSSSLTRLKLFASIFGVLFFYCACSDELYKLARSTVEAFAQCRDSSIRQQFAESLPWLCAAIANPRTPVSVREAWRDPLLSATAALCEDSDVGVASQLACSVTPLFRMLLHLYPHSGHNIVCSLIKLLGSESPEVLLVTLEQVAELASDVLKTDGEECSVFQIFFAFLCSRSMLLKTQHSWRLQLALAEQLSSFVTISPPKVINETHILPVMKHLLAQGIAAVKPAAVKVIVLSLARLHEISEPAMWQKHCRRYYLSLSQARSSTRIQQVLAVEYAMLHVPAQLCRSVFIPSMLESAAKDACSNIRLRCARSLSTIARFLIEHDGVDEDFQRLQCAASELRSLNRSPSDPDISQALLEFDDCIGQRCDAETDKPPPLDS
mmetsp:Transcript_6594/g.17714  ORF Transcript_6594/g.17714 Transcript_6594/m.17714 type:complete len:727 (+) Transcript_6594:55-2235(+)|eukprot:CAMPEP_0185830264 /NCGR_PEP_ID=MMETSP1353-20130828/725_1 /TAXON_ID=1077150 /ORGANISM="Erythrolobus australicus, Strain CCMP3124" /LENGTH=726 /DNA_ID=CAMNT_0028528141 /DNA_START=45 /DNA_END=2225 /DNA_ORIENTATION=+